MDMAVTIGYIVVALLLTVVVLFQKGKDPRAAGSVLGGNSGESFFSKNKSNTREGVLEKLTAVFAILFIILSVFISIKTK